MAEASVLSKFEDVLFVTFYVGPDKVVFHVHQNLLFDASAVFKAAFSSKFQEASERSMPLPDDDKDSFGRMIQWLYYRKFDLIVPVSEETWEECYMQLAKLNTLADKYDIYLLKNHIIDKLFDLRKPQKHFSSPQIPLIGYVYENTTQGSPFRKLMVALHVYHIDLKWYAMATTRNQIAEVSHDFAIDLAMECGAKLKHPNRSSPFLLSSSAFHETPPKKTDGGHT